MFIISNFIYQALSLVEIVVMGENIKNLLTSSFYLFYVSSVNGIMEHLFFLSWTHVLTGLDEE